MPEGPAKLANEEKIEGREYSWKYQGKLTPFATSRRGKQKKKSRERGASGGGENSRPTDLFGKKSEGNGGERKTAEGEVLG